ncbi:sensor histidine kinase [Sporanaerobium hydrogeniformans]|uniref:Sensor histidine kinase n=1 Tax=Sporanaerobium hydrogeniformans TaxID=3072179 RepID=A0AC61DB08_9FIRM|nr:ATP-binding protein [Sporanaerobium hydrogeniformans]PHV70494.1 sensor histidine kinase [Sporanaerobium hydrogeniformans]
MIKEKKIQLLYTIELIIIVLTATIIALFLRRFGIEKESIIMVFLIGVLMVITVTRGYVYGTIASLCSVLLFNYLFTEPFHTLMTYNTNDIILMLFFFCVALISGTLTTRFQKQTLLAKQNEHTARLLYEVTESFLNITGEKNILLHGISYIYKHTGYRSQVILLKTGEVYGGEPLVLVHNNYIDKLEIPIKGVNKELGRMQVYYSKEQLTLEHELLIKMVGNQMGVSLDRELIYNERENIRIAMEREHLRSNLLRGISHDLRTPLTGIVGASGLIIENMEELEPSAIKGLIKDINEEALWLNNLVENILNMTRIGEGKLVIEKRDEVVDDVIYEALHHVSGLVTEREMIVTMPEEVISLPMDGKLIVQVLINLLDNAIKHTYEGCKLYLRVYKEDQLAVFEVADNGPGIDKAIMENLFEGFVTSSRQIVDGKRGMGLGLAICKGIIEAHGGSITAGKSKEGGALFIFKLPLEEE